MARLVGDEGNNLIEGTIEDDRIIGYGGSDYLHGRGGRDVIFGGDQNDTISIGDNIDTSVGSYISGGTGKDNAILFLRGFDTDIIISADNRHVFSQDAAGNRQSIVQMESIEVIAAYLGSGNDVVRTSDIHYLNESSQFYAGAGDDRLYGGIGQDTLYGEDGDDIIHDKGGRNELSGGAGNDRIWGGADVDTIAGGDGDDVLYGNGGDDFIQGNEGNDRLSGGDGHDQMQGDGGDDVLYGNAGRDKLRGMDGDDILIGGADADILIGDAGDDHLYGGTGIDRLTGGAGRDSFHWTSPEDGGDRVLDFTPGEDVLALDSAGFGGITVVDTNNFVANTHGSAADADDRFLYSLSTRGLYYDPDGTGPAAKIQISYVDFTVVGATLTVNDIVMV